MEIVIDISEEMYNFACNYPEKILAGYSLCIKNGTPLPKGHGRLIDADDIMNDIKNDINEMTNIGIGVDGQYLWEKLNDAIYNAPTIIEGSDSE